MFADLIPGEWLVVALAILNLALLLYAGRLRLELWASRRVIAALEVADIREPKKPRSSKSTLPALLAVALVLLALSQALGHFFG